jgi:hypothetical protein
VVERAGAVQRNESRDGVERDGDHDIGRGEWKVREVERRNRSGDGHSATRSWFRHQRLDRPQQGGCECGDVRLRPGGPPDEVPGEAVGDSPHECCGTVGAEPPAEVPGEEPAGDENPEGGDDTRRIRRWQQEVGEEQRRQTGLQ